MVITFSYFHFTITFGQNCSLPQHMALWKSALTVNFLSFHFYTAVTEQKKHSTQSSTTSSWTKKSSAQFAVDTM